MKPRSLCTILAVLLLSALVGCSSQSSNGHETSVGDVNRYPNTTEWIASADGVLSLRLSSDKTEYVSGESIEVKLELRNDSDATVKAEALEYALGSYGNALTIEGPIELGYFGPWKEYYVPPSDMLPGEIISGTTTLSVVHWKGLDAIGEYRLKCVYQSGNITQVEGVWIGSIHSATLGLKVDRKRIDAARAEQIALNHVRSSSHLENIDTTRVSITRRDDVQTYVVDFAWKDAGQIKSGLWDTGYYVVLDATSGDVLEAYPYER